MKSLFLVAFIFAFVATAQAQNCALCEYTVGQIASALANNATAQNIIHEVDQACQQLPASLRTECKEFIDTYGPQIIVLLASDIDPKKICTLIGECSSNVAVEEKQKVQVETVEASTECAICEFVLNYIEKEIQANATEQEIVAALLKVCDELPSTVEGICTQFLDQYAVSIINLLLSKVPPQLVCTTLGLCSSKVAAAELSKPIAAPKNVEASTECAICEFVLNYIEKEIQANATEQEIVAALLKVCDALPSTVEGICTQFLDQYAVSIINLLLSKVPPQLVCTTLGLCSSSSKSDKIAPAMNLNKTKQVTVPAVGGSTECTICEFVLNFIEKEIQANATEQEIVAALLKVCNELPSTVEGVCTEFLDDYAVAILNLLISKIPPQVVCTTLGVCSSEASKVVSQNTLKEAVAKAFARNI